MRLHPSAQRQGGAAQSARPIDTSGMKIGDRGRAHRAPLSRDLAHASNPRQPVINSGNHVSLRPPRRDPLPRRPSAPAPADRDPWLKTHLPPTSSCTPLVGERSGRDLIRHFEQVAQLLPAKHSAADSPTRSQYASSPFRNEKGIRGLIVPTNSLLHFFQPGESHDFIVMSNGSAETLPGRRPRVYAYDGAPRAARNTRCGLTKA